jgi:diguanylate cyclase (GGDEF)-like protein
MASSKAERGREPLSVRASGWHSTMDQRSLSENSIGITRVSGPQQSLVRRLTWLGLTVLGVALLLSILALGAITFYAVRDQQLRSVDEASMLLADNLAPTLAFQDAQAAAQLLKSFSGRGDLLELQVWSPGGRAFAQWKAPLAASLPWRGGVASTLVDGDGIQLVRKVELQGEVVGWLVWHESFAALRATLLRLALGAALVLLLALLGAGLLLSWWQRRALRPLLTLGKLAEHVAATQDYALRAPVVRRDEVGRLAMRFNDMLRRIEVWHADLHQQLRQEQHAGSQMRQLAHRDQLTGLPNRLSFEVELERQLVEVHLAQQRLALLFIDLDQFKQVNDTLGHAAGDEVLVEMAARMGRVLRSHDTLCRLGGDEFALLVPQVQDPVQVMQLAERLIAAVREPLLIRGQRVPVGASVGMAFSPDHALDAQALLAAADEAMYAAKRAGKNTYRCAPEPERESPV